MDIFAACLDGLAASGARLALIGTGEAYIEQAILAAAKRHPGRLGVVLGYDEGLSHLVQAGCDTILVPSRFEPCGLTQLYGLRYGCLPSVLAFYRQHGGNTSRRQLGLLRWTYGVYRRHGLPPLRALLHTGLWGAGHGLRLARRRVLPQPLLPSMLTLQAAPPWQRAEGDRGP
jgi:hypothetical protein